MPPEQPPSEEAALPPIWNVPHERNPDFTGREQILEQLHDSLAAGQAAALTQAQTIHGLGGVGKTQIAAEYAYRHRDDYDVVWWLRCEEAATLTADYAALAVQLGLPEAQAMEQKVTIAAVKRWLEANGRWLLVFDNAAQVADVQPYLPHDAHGHVLITSRNPAWEEAAKPVQVRTWPRKRSVEYLLKRTGGDDAAGADAVAEALGDLPLALAQAAAYIEQTGMTFGQYAKSFETERVALLEKGKPSRDYTETVATTWNLSLQEVRTQPGAAELLSLCAFLAPEDIPQDVLVQGAEHLPEPLRDVLSDPLKLQQALGALRRYSLLEVGYESWSMHRLVQLVTREQMEEGCQRTWARAALSLLSRAFPLDSQDVRSWHDCRRLLPHALAAAGRAEDPKVAREATAYVLNQVGVYLKGRAQFGQAAALLRRAMSAYEAALGQDHPHVAAAANNLGGVLREQGDLAGAREQYERALRIAEAAYGPGHTHVATAANNLGGVLQDLGDLAGAREQYEQALRIAEAAYGPDHPNVATMANNLGIVLQDLGDLAGARELIGRALRIDEGAYGPDHPDVARDANNLGMVLQLQGDLAAARELYQRALRTDEAAYGPDHPTVATVVNNLGGALREQGDLGGARAMFERAQRIDEAAYGPDHPKVATDVSNLGLVLQEQGDLAGARALFERALAIRLRFLGEDHPSTRAVRRNLEALDKGIQRPNF